MSGIQAGAQLGSYQITSLLGKGGMGEVYRARDTKLNPRGRLETLEQAREDEYH